MMRKTIFYLIAFAFSFLSTQIVTAQTVDTGREVLKGEMNFTDVANYLLKHPEPPVMHAVENDEDGDEHPLRTLPVDPTKVFSRRPPPPGMHLSLLPVSPSPTDTFDAVLDPGTNIPPDTHVQWIPIIALLQQIPR